MNLDEYRKAICAAFVAGAGAVATGAVDGHISIAEGCLAAVAFFSALGGVATVSNTQPPKPIEYTPAPNVTQTFADPNYTAPLANLTAPKEKPRAKRDAHGRFTK